MHQQDGLADSPVTVFAVRYTFQTERVLVLRVKFVFFQRVTHLNDCFFLFQKSFVVRTVILTCQNDSSCNAGLSLGQGTCGSKKKNTANMPALVDSKTRKIRTKNRPIVSLFFFFPNRFQINVIM